MATGDRDDVALARRRRRHVGRLLFELSTSFERESFARLREMGYSELTQAQKQVIVHLPLAGARLTELAARAGVSKQAMMRLVDGLEVLGYVERVDDPEDLRAKQVRMTRQGRRLLDDALTTVSELEAEYIAVLGDKRFERLRSELARLADGLGLRMPDPEP
ncbi:MarR family winged helix-turn-helix transcriptional regulator [Haliangium sp.]|uniref:MarR family winged helix-turn-helix transcriptional regulator n=1 Tax=Haliangium sp. TaxID=2663208 RepID=UPI003D138872